MEIYLIILLWKTGDRKRMKKFLEIDPDEIIIYPLLRDSTILLKRACPWDVLKD